jgi:hypothetical protein
MQHLKMFALVKTFALAAIFSFFLSSAQAREITELRERVSDAVKRTDKDVNELVHRDKLSDQQRQRFDTMVKDLEALQEAVKGDKWEAERPKMERAVESLEYFSKSAPIPEGDRQLLGIDAYTMGTILESWKKPEPEK